ncbi:hypothetical protein LTS18_010362, partial [Coniosporium uncinatum]
MDVSPDDDQGEDGLKGPSSCSDSVVTDTVNYTFPGNSFISTSLYTVSACDVTANATTTTVEDGPACQATLNVSPDDDQGQDGDGGHFGDPSPSDGGDGGISTMPASSSMLSSNPMSSSSSTVSSTSSHPQASATTSPKCEDKLHLSVARPKALEMASEFCGSISSTKANSSDNGNTWAVNFTFPADPRSGPQVPILEVSVLQSQKCIDQLTTNETCSAFFGKLIESCGDSGLLYGGIISDSEDCFSYSAFPTPSGDEAKIICWPKDDGTSLEWPDRTVPALEMDSKAHEFCNELANFTGDSTASGTSWAKVFDVEDSRWNLSLSAFAHSGCSGTTWDAEQCYYNFKDLYVNCTTEEIERKRGGTIDDGLCMKWVMNVGIKPEAASLIFASSSTTTPVPTASCDDNIGPANTIYMGWSSHESSYDFRVFRGPAWTNFEPCYQAPATQISSDMMPVI